MKKKTCLALMAVFTLCFTACSDDAIVDALSSNETNDVCADLGVTCGYNVMVFGDEGQSEWSVPLSTTNVSVSSTNKDFGYKVGTRDGKPVLLVTLQRHSSDACHDVVTVTDASNRENKNTVRIFVRPQLATATRAGEIGTKDEEKIIYYGLEKLGRVTHPLSSTSNSGISIFNKNLLESMYANKSSKYGVSVERKTSTTATFSSTYNSHLQTVSHTAGLGLNLPFKGIMFNNKASFSKKTEVQKEEEREYMDYKKRTVIGSLTLKPEVEVIAPIEGPKQYYIYALDSLVNNTLNNPGTKEYQAIKDTPDALFEYLDRMGGYMFNTSVVLGGEFACTVSKLKTVSKKSISEVVDVSARASRHQNLQDPKVYAGAQTYLEMIGKAGWAAKEAWEYYGTQSPSAGGSYKFDKNTVDEFRQMDVNVTLESRGGSDDYSEQKPWVVTDDPNKWVTLCYSNTVYFDNMMEGKNPTNYEIHSILDLMPDTTSTRYKIIKELITPDASTGKIPFFERKGYYGSTSRTKLVVVDAFLDGMTSDQSYPISRLSPVDNKEHLYYPVVANANIEEKRSLWMNKVLCLNDVKFAGRDWNDRSTPLVLWVAVEWLDQTEEGTNGITDIFVGYDGHQNNAKGIIKRGVYTDWGVSGTPYERKHRYLYVQRGNYTTPADDFITGVCVYFTKWDSDNGSNRGAVIGSSLGTDWIREYSEPKHIKDFEHYWNVNDDSWVRGEDVHDKLHSIIKMENRISTTAARRPLTIQIGYTKKPITRDLSGLSAVGEDRYTNKTSYMKEIKRNRYTFLEPEKYK